jgi:hypothetical protein
MLMARISVCLLILSGKIRCLCTCRTVPSRLESIIIESTLILEPEHAGRESDSTVPSPDSMGIIDGRIAFSSGMFGFQYECALYDDTFQPYGQVVVMTLIRAISIHNDDLTIRLESIIIESTLILEPEHAGVLTSSGANDAHAVWTWDGRIAFSSGMFGFQYECAYKGIESSQIESVSTRLFEPSAFITTT